MIVILDNYFRGSFMAPAYLYGDEGGFFIYLDVTLRSRMYSTKFDKSNK